MKRTNANILLTQSSFAVCGESIKLKDAKEEEESVGDPHQEIENSNVCEDIKKEINEEENILFPSFNQQEIGNVWLDYFEL